MKKNILFGALILTAVFIAAIMPGNKNTVTVIAVGDILLSRGVEKKIEQYGTGYPYLKLGNVLKKSDFVSGNLECPLTEEGVPSLKRGNLLFKARKSNSYALRAAGFNVLSLANNHIMDYNGEGLLNTVNALHTAGISTVGAGSDVTDAHKPLFMKKNNINIGFISFSTFPPEGYFHFDDKPDVAFADNSRIGEEIRNARLNCDFLIVSFHWGKEFSYYADESQIQIAHTAIDSGADMVIGHHPHVLQGVEVYKGKPVFYSLGNFIFDSQIPKGTDETIIAKIKLGKNKIESIELVPVKIKDCQPFEPDRTEAKYILDRTRLYSGSMSKNITISQGKGILELY